jgi:hypothetical protein
MVTGEQFCVINLAGILIKFVVAHRNFLLRSARDGVLI